MEPEREVNSMDEFLEEGRKRIEEVFDGKKAQMGVEAELELDFIDHMPGVDEPVYASAFPHEKPPRVEMDVFLPDATDHDILETVCDELLHIKHPDLKQYDENYHERKEFRDKILTCMGSEDDES